MSKISIDANGSVDLNVPSFWQYTVVYVLADLAEGTTLELKMFGEPLTDGLITTRDQLRIDHGQGADLTIVATGITTPIDIVILGG